MDLPGISAQNQTVNKSNCALLYNLVQSLKRKSGHGLLLNTSFNRKEVSIVCNPEDAFDGIQNSPNDIMVVRHSIIIK